MSRYILFNSGLNDWKQFERKEGVTLLGCKAVLNGTSQHFGTACQ